MVIQNFSISSVFVHYVAVSHYPYVIYTIFLIVALCKILLNLNSTSLGLQLKFEPVGHMEPSIKHSLSI